MSRVASALASRPAWLSQADPLRFGDHYAWLVLVSAMDLMLTFTVLMLGGAEVNPLADVVWTHCGFWGLIGFKFAIVMLVVVICEQVAKSNLVSARRLVCAAVLLSALPVVVGGAQLGGASWGSLWAVMAMG